MDLRLHHVAVFTFKQCSSAVFMYFSTLDSVISGWICLNFYASDRGAQPESAEPYVGLSHPVVTLIDNIL